MTAPTFEQVELAERVLAFIETHPESLDQTTFLETHLDGTQGYIQERTLFEELLSSPSPESALKYNTAGCFAGWTAILDRQPITMRWTIPDTNQSLDAWAADRLGIPRWEGDPDDNHLFSDNNTLEDLREHVSWMRAECLLAMGTVDA